jgi:hypothetical protein
LTTTCFLAVRPTRSSQRPANLAGEPERVAGRRRSGDLVEQGITTHKQFANPITRTMNEAIGGNRRVVGFKIAFFDPKRAILAKLDFSIPDLGTALAADQRTFERIVQGWQDATGGG